MDHKNDCSHCNCPIASTNRSVHQTLSEMDWERGIWNAGDKERIIFLIDRARNAKDLVNSLDNSGYSALHYAARRGHLDICSLLLKNGAYINAQTRSGMASPLHKAVAAGKEDVVKFLIESGAQVELQDADGKTILHKAIENNNHSLVTMFIESYPSLKIIKDNKGNLPLKKINDMGVNQIY